MRKGFKLWEAQIIVSAESIKTPSATTVDVDKTPVAKDIWCYSPREKAFTWHVVVNHDINGYVDRVQCKVTGTIHKYKRQNKASSSSSTVKKTLTRSAKTKVAVPAVDLETLWYNGIKEWGSKVVKTYSPQNPLQKGDVLEHPIFGKGVVQARRDNKIDVLFKAGPKTLLSAKA